jgi:hypothetical protein
MMSQITRVQGMFSYRAWHANAGLHCIAANCGCTTTVLEWPSLEEFSAMLRQTFYAYVGISFIPSTYAKMREMVKTVRAVSPRSKIVIGGHGVMVPDLEHTVDVDYICKGDGIRFIRNLFSRQPQFTFNHPVITSVITEFLGVPIPFQQTGQIVTSLGCRYGCEFCVTSAFFDCEYQPFLSDGHEVYQLLKSQNHLTKLRNYWVIDENFLSDRTRSEQLLRAIEDDCQELPDISIDMIWSSSDQVASYAPEQLAKMGITKIWMGYESRFSPYRKNSGTDFKKMIADLGEFGISVLLSCTAFSDSHDETTWNDEVATFIQLGQAYSQFLPLTAFPGTALYKKMERAGRIIDSVPYEERHALTTAFHRHETIPLWKQERLILDAYAQEYRRNGPSQLRDIGNRANGCCRMQQSRDAVLRKKADYLSCQLTRQAPWVIASRNHVAAISHRNMVDEILGVLQAAIGKEKMDAAVALGAHFEKMICRSLKERDGAAVFPREPGLRLSRYDGWHAQPTMVKNPEVW